MALHGAHGGGGGERGIGHSVHAMVASILNRPLVSPVRMHLHLHQRPLWLYTLPAGLAGVTSHGEEIVNLSCQLCVTRHPDAALCPVTSLLSQACRRCTHGSQQVSSIPG